MVSSNLIICADDYAQNAAISEGMLHLARVGRIQAISCLVNGKDWPTHAVALKSLTSTAVGLHLNMTWGNALSSAWKKSYGASFLSLKEIIRLTYCKQLALQVLKEEVRAQWDCFVEHYGKAPDFIDGHQHVHQLPIVREALLAVYQEKQAKGFMRSTANGWQDLWSWDAFPKAQILWLLGGGTFRKRLGKIPTNTSFSGFYPFRKSAQYREHFRQFLAKSKQHGLIMCHPGLASSDETDPLYLSRPDEYAYLMSDAYLEDLKEYHFL